MPVPEPDRECERAIAGQRPGPRNRCQKDSIVLVTRVGMHARTDDAVSGERRFQRHPGFNHPAQQSRSTPSGPNRNRSRSPSLPSRASRQAKAEVTALARFAFLPDVAAMDFDDGPSDGEPEPRAPVLARSRRLGPIKTVENTRPIRIAAAYSTPASPSGRRMPMAAPQWRCSRWLSAAASSRSFENSVNTSGGERRAV